MAYWSTLAILNQAAGELGLPQSTTWASSTSTQATQMLALLQAAGNELVLYYPWEQLAKQFNISLVSGQDSYALPTDYSYFRDQTQWDSVNHWPLLGPKSAQEWAWLKNSFVATLPRMRFRIQGNQFKVFPVPGADVPNAFYMEYISSYWVAPTATPTTGTKAMITLDDDIPLLDPWLLVKYLKLKYYELKGFDLGPVQRDFMKIFTNLTGKDTGAPILSLAPVYTDPYLGPRSIPDGSWNV